MNSSRIVIVGGGLCGSLLALRLAQRGFKIDVYESRPDLRSHDISAGRSINLALSNRGFKALEMAGVAEEARKICIPMYGRMIHDQSGGTFASNYSGNGLAINSISRGDLNGLLLTHAEKHPNVNLHFNMECREIDIENNILKFFNHESGVTHEEKADVIFGTDGAGSALRKSYFMSRKFLFNFSQQYLTHGYKELEIPAKEGNHQISKDHLHIWPRGKYMLIALPNLDGSFTVTLFLGHEEGEYHFKGLDTEEKINQFFHDQFPDALALIPEIEKQFAKNPTGALGTIKCSPWYYKGNNLIMGDAAHAVVPFYGQGMNASFEDVYELDQFIEKYQTDLSSESPDWSRIFREYHHSRLEDAYAIGDLAEENYYEMRDKVADPTFIKKRKIEMQLEQKYPDYLSKYSMVTFSEHMPYSEAMKKGREQDAFLLEYCKDRELEDIVIEEVYAELVRRSSTMSGG